MFEEFDLAQPFCRLDFGFVDARKALARAMGENCVSTFDLADHAETVSQNRFLISNEIRKHRALETLCFSFYLRLGTRTRSFSVVLGWLSACFLGTILPVFELR